MLCPGDIEAIDTLVNHLQSLNLLLREFLLYDDDEINIAVDIEITHRERALQIGTHEIRTHDILHAICQIAQDSV